MSQTITGIVTNGVVVPSTPLPEGARVEIQLKADDDPSVRRGVPAAQVRGIAAGAASPPDDDTVKRWVEEGRTEKHG